MKIYPNLAYIVVQRPARPDEGQRLAKAAGVQGNTARQDIDVAMFLDRESAEGFRDSDFVLREYAEVVEVVVMDGAQYDELEDNLKNPNWMPAELPPEALPIEVT